MNTDPSQQPQSTSTEQHSSQEMQTEEAISQQNISKLLSNYLDDNRIKTFQSAMIDLYFDRLMDFERMEEDVVEILNTKELNKYHGQYLNKMLQERIQVLQQYQKFLKEHFTSEESLPLKTRILKKFFERTPSERTHTAIQKHLSDLRTLANTLEEIIAKKPEQSQSSLSSLIDTHFKCWEIREEVQQTSFKYYRESDPNQKQLLKNQIDTMQREFTTLQEQIASLKDTMLKNPVPEENPVSEAEEIEIEKLS